MCDTSGHLLARSFDYEMQVESRNDLQIYNEHLPHSDKACKEAFLLYCVADYAMEGINYVQLSVFPAACKNIVTDTQMDKRKFQSLLYRADFDLKCC